MAEQFTDPTRRVASEVAGKVADDGAGQAGHANAYASEPDFVDPHLLDYVRILYKRRWTALTAFLLVVGAATVYTFTATPIYEARAKLLIEADNPNVVTFKAVIEEAQQRTDYYQTQYDILKSRSLARRTLDTLKLWDHPAFGGQAPGGFSVRRAAADAFAAVSGLFHGTDRQGADPSGPPETAAQSRAIDRLLADLTVSPVRNSRIVDLKFRSADPDLATRIVNAHARGYIDQSLEFKFLASKEASDWLGARLAEQRKQVEAAEAALQQYRELNDAISLEDRQNIVVQKLADLNAAVTRAKTERIEKEALHDQLRAIQQDRAALDSFPAILANPFIQQLKAELAGLQRQQAELADKLGDRHPDLIKVRSSIKSADAKLQAEIANVVQSVRNQFLAAEAQERSLVAALEAQKREALAMNRKAIDYGVLQRDVESNRQIYESLLQRAKETGVSSELRASNIRIVDAAEQPRRPVVPDTGLNLLLALLGGGLIAISLTFFFEYLDNRLKSPEEIKAHLGVPFLGLVPLVTPKQVHGGAPLISNGVPANFAEAFSVVRMNVLFSSAESGPKSMVVTSTGPSEGKTIVASNLALGLAQTGQRVLVVDADMRRPQAHQVFGQKLEPGLSNLLVGNAKASEVMRKTTAAGLWVLPAGRVPPNPAELLASERFRDFLRTLKEHFDWVIIDSPPVMAVADAALAAHTASGVVFVVGADMTSRRTAQAALEQLTRARANVVGAVLNRANLDGHAYYYSKYYHKEYGRYYLRKVS